MNKLTQEIASHCTEEMLNAARKLTHACSRFLVDQVVMEEALFSEEEMFLICLMAGQVLVESYIKMLSRRFNIKVGSNEEMD